MEDRRQDEGRTDRSGQGQEYSQYDPSRRSMTTQQRQDTDADRWAGSSGSGGTGQMQGYVVPYRYYGQGYRGVGYYAVFYQGAGGEQASEYSQDQGQWSQGDKGASSRYGQGDARQWSGDRSGGGSSSYGQGGFAGRGPKGYQRSDDRLREEVSDRLMENDQIDAGEIEVQVRDGEVILTGTVPERWMKRLAEDLAEQVMGVRDVQNQIRLEDGQAPSRQSGSRTRGAQPTRSNQERATNGRPEAAPSGSR